MKWNRNRHRQVSDCLLAAYSGGIGAMVTGAFSIPLFILTTVVAVVAIVVRVEEMGWEVKDNASRDSRSR